MSLSCSACGGIPAVHSCVQPWTDRARRKLASWKLCCARVEPRRAWTTDVRRAVTDGPRTGGGWWRQSGGVVGSRVVPSRAADALTLIDVDAQHAAGSPAQPSPAPLALLNARSSNRSSSFSVSSLSSALPPPPPPPPRRDGTHSCCWPGSGPSLAPTAPRLAGTPTALPTRLAPPVVAACTAPLALPCPAVPSSFSLAIVIPLPHCLCGAVYEWQVHNARPAEGLRQRARSRSPSMSRVLPAHSMNSRETGGLVNEKRPSFQSFALPVPHSLAGTDCELGYTTRASHLAR